MSKAFDRIVIVMFENQYRSYVMQDPFMKKLAGAGASMSNFFGVFHPSQTNYIASLAGEVCAVTNDIPPPSPLPQQTLVDLLEAGDVSWKAYMEALPDEEWNPLWKQVNYPAEHQPIAQYPEKGPQLARYFRKHNAFASFQTIQSDQERWTRIVDEVAFWKDVETDSLPEYSWFTPDIWNDGHYLYNTHIDTDPRTQLVPQMSGWLEYVFLGDIAAENVQGGAATGLKNLGLNIDVDLLLQDSETAWKQSRVPKGTLIVITFDEADYDAQGYDTAYDGPNQIYAVLLGDMIRPGTVIDTPFNHYSLIRTIEKNYGLGDLGKNDQAANWFRFLWKEEFSWDQPAPTNLSANGALAMAYIGETAVLISKSNTGDLMYSTFYDNAWAQWKPAGLKSSGSFALSAIGATLHLVFTGANGEVFAATCNGAQEWSSAQSLGETNQGDITMTSYSDYADQGRRKLMLCWQAENGFIESRIFSDGAWQANSIPVGQLTDGPMSLASLGSSVFLVYKERNTRRMRMTSFNTAPFNAFGAKNFEDAPAPENNTTLHQWSPADFPVGNFAKKMAALQNDYQALGHLAMASIDGEMHLVHRGAYPDTPNAYTEYFGLTGIFTAANQYTNGYGTIDQAGWTVEKEMPDVQLDPKGGLAIASTGERLLLIWQETGKSDLNFKAGGY